MNGLHKIFGVAALATFALGGTTTAQAADCGTAETVTIAEMTWLSAASLAHVTQRILDAGYGCDAQLVPGDTVPTATSMPCALRKYPIWRAARILPPGERMINGSFAPSPRWRALA